MSDAFMNVYVNVYQILIFERHVMWHGGSIIRSAMKGAVYAYAQGSSEGSKPGILISLPRDL